VGGRILQPSIAAVWQIADRQHGVITRAQLLEIGSNRRAIEHRIRIGRLHPIWSGIYAVGRPRISIEARWMAAVLSCGPTALLSHLSAGSLFQIHRSALWPIHVSVAQHVVRKRPGIVVHRRAWLGEEVSTVHLRIPATTPTQTVIDLASRLRPEAVEAAINEADKRNLVSPEQLRASLDSVQPQPGVGVLRRILDRESFRLTDSELERMMLRLVAPLGIGPPQTGVWLNGFKVDFFWPRLGLVIETDGLRYHRTPTQQRRDRLRDQAHAAAGLTPLRFTHAQVRYQPMYVAATVLAVVQRLKDLTTQRWADASAGRREEL
jgi:Protein of unknown function (DUF559)